MKDILSDLRMKLPQKAEASFNEIMLQQLGLLKLNETDQKIAEQIVGSLDDDGYLRREVNAIIDDLAFRQNITTNLIACWYKNNLICALEL